MTISEAASQGITRLTRPEWSWTSFIELYLNDGQYGPWVKVCTIPLEPQQILLMDLPIGGYQPWIVPEDSRAYYNNEIDPRFKQSLWQPTA